MQLRYTLMPLIGLTSLLFGGCAHNTVKPNPAIEKMLDLEVGDLDKSLAEKIMAEPRNFKSKSRQRVEGEIHQKVWWWLRYYTVRDRERFRRAIERGETYRPLVQKILIDSELPPELYYLAMVESGYVTRAHSSASAIGIWQFLRPTAQHFGLQVDGVLDERLQPAAATLAASKYLRFLHHKFKSWYLAIAAYNAGQGRIERAVRAGKTNDFWALVERGYLPQETMDYIPKFLAAATIGSHLEHFGFFDLKPQPAWPELASVKLGRNQKVSDVILRTGLTESEFYKFNPQIKSRSFRSSRRTRVWLPVSVSVALQTPQKERSVRAGL